MIAARIAGKRPFCIVQQRRGTYDLNIRSLSLGYTFSQPINTLDMVKSVYRVILESMGRSRLLRISTNPF